MLTQQYLDDCLFCAHINKFGQEPELVATPLSLPDILNLKGSYSGFAYTLHADSQAQMFGPRPGDPQWIPKDNAAVVPEIVGQATTMPYKASLCFGNFYGSGPYIGSLEPETNCDYTLYFNLTDRAFTPVAETSVGEKAQYEVTRHNVSLTWGNSQSSGRASWQAEILSIQESPNCSPTWGVDKWSGTPWVLHNDLPMYNLTNSTSQRFLVPLLVYRNILCQFSHTHMDRPGLFPSLLDHHQDNTDFAIYHPLCMDDYVRDNRPAWTFHAKWKPTLHPAQFGMSTKEPFIVAHGYTGAVTLKGTGHYFLCGANLFMTLPASWRGLCTVVQTSIQPPGCRCY
ncbi:uncharacterized protein LOC132541185 [Erinaceus europaeus]|uniref:Uncharacterized protein LOC132541185 n=1 Tax=Erinaceus europaeus TaxID=9365 RepID=A0ABM3Y795_ERIEU|nr:uncharacterized protein LOC132541185 [Erinaceus europaeus]